MDYEKKYKNALGWIKALYPTMEGAFKEDAEHFFPELAESEDERIRKELLDIIQKSYELGGFTLNSKKDLERYVTWLEKQKEQKSEEVDESTKRMNDNWMKQHFDDYKEQKPAEWSEEDEKNKSLTINLLQRGMVEGYGSFEDAYQDAITWLKSLKDRIKGR